MWCKPCAALAHDAPDRITASTNDTESGEVAEWSNVLDSKSSVGATLPRVRIPPSPPNVKPYRGFFAIRLFCYRICYRKVDLVMCQVPIGSLQVSQTSL
jgi:hypothetical protein